MRVRLNASSLIETCNDVVANVRLSTDPAVPSGLTLLEVPPCLEAG